MRGGAPALVAIAAAIGCGAGAAYLLAQQDDAKRLQEATDLVADERFADAVAEARSVERSPAAERSHFVEAYALIGLGRLKEAARAFARAARADPQNWVVYRDWARVQLVLGERARAGRTMAKAKALNPRLRLPAGFHPAPPRRG